MSTSRPRRPRRHHRRRRRRACARRTASAARPARCCAACRCDVARGEFVALMGPSGCGKSTLLHILGGLEPPDAGIVVGRGRGRCTASTTARCPRSAATASASSSSSSTCSPTSPRPRTWRCRCGCATRARAGTATAGSAARDISDRVALLMDQLNLHGLQGHGPEEISGGEQQRVAIARALAAAPALLLADEPTGNLDWTTGHEVMALLGRLCRSQQQTTVLVTHDARVAAHADRVLVMRDGQIVDEVAPDPRRRAPARPPPSASSSSGWASSTCEPSPWALARRAIRGRPLRALLTGVAVALGIAVVLGVSITITGLDAKSTRRGAVVGRRRPTSTSASPPAPASPPSDAASLGQPHRGQRRGAALREARRRPAQQRQTSTAPRSTSSPLRGGSVALRPLSLAAGRAPARPTATPRWCSTRAWPPPLAAAEHRAPAGARRQGPADHRHRPGHLHRSSASATAAGSAASRATACSSPSTPMLDQFPLGLRTAMVALQAQPRRPTSPRSPTR